MSKGIKIVVTFLIIILLILFVVFFFSRKNSEYSEKVKNIRTEEKKKDDNNSTIDTDIDIEDDENDEIDTDEEIEEDVNVVDTAVDDSLSNYVEIDDFDLILNNNNLKIASTTYLTTRVYPYNASNYKISYVSSNNSIAKVSKNGMITGIGVGKCYIIATSNNGISKQIKIVVTR